jgi:hypothetical protein
MARLVKILCARCRAPLLWVRERSMENDALFRKFELLGVPLHEAGAEIACPHCGNAVHLPRESFDALERKGLEAEGEEG